MILALLFINVLACCLITVSGLWLATDASKSRSARLCCALITCGAVVNVFALWVAFKALHHDHPVTWPTEAVLNVGSAVLLGRWALSRPRHEAIHSEPAAEA